jgi:hypothetical protein
MPLPTLPTFSDQERDELKAFIEANRARALWHLPRSYFPEDTNAVRRVIERIATRGDRATWIQARRWLQELS